MDKSNNMYIYEQARKVPENAQRAITAGRLKGKTDINPMWRIKKLTEIFGPCGLGWWYEIVKKEIVPYEYEITTYSNDGTATKKPITEIAAFVDILLYYVVDPKTGEISHGVPGTGGNMFVENESKGIHVCDECFKKALTDAISVAAKALGIGADVYWNADSTKYTDAREASEQPSTPQKNNSEPIPPEKPKSELTILAERLGKITGKKKNELLDECKSELGIDEPREHKKEVLNWFQFRLAAEEGTAAS